MEKALLKLARQLDGFDEASLMALWDKYQGIVQDFQPSRQWQEAVLILSMIQSVRWKNQLFNHHWAGMAGAQQDQPCEGCNTGGCSGPDSGNGLKERGKVLRFRPREGDNPV
ncbi:MAG: hypothetical protein ACOC24_04800 [Desulfovibrionales bacterium]